MDSLLTSWQLAQRQGLPLEAKIHFSQERIREWYEHYDGCVAVSFSGGKDSSALLHLVRSSYPDTPAVFVDTGLEFPENKSLVQKTDNIRAIRPKVSFKEVIENHGYPFPSKEQAQYIEELRTTKSDKLMRLRWFGRKGSQGKISNRWRYLIDAPFKVSAKCCNILKKNPAHLFQRDTGLQLYVGNKAVDSRLRTQSYLATGCNSYDAIHPLSRPLSIWSDEDVWSYIRQNDIPYSAVYDMGYERTGCVFCLFGIAQEKRPNRFERLLDTHPRLYNYCMKTLHLDDVLAFVGIPH